ncbi:MAG: putative DNA modification/repair radical SAM protein [Candidatus Heimdallarchaeota archaeon]
MTSQEKIQVLAEQGRYDSVGLNTREMLFQSRIKEEKDIWRESDSFLAKIHTLGAGGKYDVCASTASSRCGSSSNQIGNTVASGICHSYTPDGRCVSLFKTLYTNVCTFDCKYCMNSTCSTRRNKVGHYSYTPNELATIFMKLYLRNYVEGLFLSSGIKGDVDKTMEDLLESVQILRTKYRFRGYIHLKILPGASYEHIRQAVEWADRVSINVEAPSASRLSEIAGVKDYRNDILRRQTWIQGLQKQGMLPAGQTTQFIVGAGNETDLEILNQLKWEYNHLGLKRGYFSVFDPVAGTPLESRAAVPHWREHRLYQFDWLMRVYKFDFSELKQVLTEDGLLLNADPKRLLAKMTLDRPIDINDGTYNELLKVPGIGPKSASRINRLQETGVKIKSYEQLKRIGVVLRRASPFIVVNGKFQETLDKWWK